MKKAPLSYQQQLRYSRHIMLPSLDIEGQEQLWQSHVVILGVGGLGCVVAQSLAASGVGELSLIDGDKIEAHNLQRQILFTEQRVGEFKAQAAKQQLQQLNSEITINAITTPLSEQNPYTDLIQQADMVIDCSDNLNTRNLLNKLCFNSHTPLVSGSAIRLEGHVACFTMTAQSHCYGCISQFISSDSHSCSESGVLSPVVGIIGSIQATEAVKMLAGLNSSLTEQLLLLDGLSMSFNKFNISKHPQCPVCSHAV